MIKIGFGRDIHSLSKLEGRELVLGGIKIPFEKKVIAHSDGDVLYHALAEAILGALGKGDLGIYFPENDDKYDNFDSRKIVLKTLKFLSSMHYKINNVDISIICEKPKLRPYIKYIKESVQKLLSLTEDCVSIKAQTNEKIDGVGEGLAIEVIAVILIESIN